MWAFKSLEARKAQKGKLCSFCKRSLGKKVLQDMLLKALKFKNPQKGKLFSFCKPPTWWKEVCRSKKANFTHFVSRPLWQKEEAFQSLEVRKVWKRKFYHFVIHKSLLLEMLNLHTSRTVEQVGGRWCLRPPPTREKYYLSKKSLTTI